MVKWFFVWNINLCVLATERSNKWKICHFTTAHHPLFFLLPMCNTQFNAISIIDYNNILFWVRGIEYWTFLLIFFYCYFFNIKQQLKKWGIYYGNFSLEFISYGHMFWCWFSLSFVQAFRHRNLYIHHNKRHKIAINAIPTKNDIDWKNNMKITNNLI